MFERRAWQIIAVLSLLPAVAYFVILVFALCFGVLGPAIWMAEDLLEGPWAIPLLWILVIGGPMLSMISSLILGLGRQSGVSVGRACGVIAWILLILDFLSCLPFPWILAVEQ